MSPLSGSDATDALCPSLTVEFQTRLNGLTEVQQQKALHVQLLSHALSCQSCTSPNCPRMKEMFATYEQNVESPDPLTDFCQRFFRLAEYHKGKHGPSEDLNNCRCCRLRSAAIAKGATVVALDPAVVQALTSVHF